MNWELLGSAVALVLVFEGLTPVISPHRFRRIVSLIDSLSDRQLRAMGAASMVAGATLLYLVKHIV